MKKQFLVLAAVATVVVTIVAVSCKRNLDAKGDFAPRATNAGWSNPDGLPLDVVPSQVNTGQTVTLTADKCWVLTGKCFVDDGGVLEIEEGTRVEAVKAATSATSSAIVITRGGQIRARGNEEAPIIFTSHEDCPHSGDWGGIVLLGKAPLNRADTTIEGINLPTVPAGIDVNYGGGGACAGDSLDNSGIIEFARIEYAGAVISPDNELNGLTCGGVGAGTKLEHIEVAYGNDDAFEFFGGTVNAKWIIALAPDDDAFDFDFGYTGSIQFAVSILHDTLGYSANPNGIESDNNATGDCNTCKKTRARISNMTVVGLCDSTTERSIVGVPGGGLLNSSLFRRCSDVLVRNSVFMGFPIGPKFESAGSITSSANFQYNTVQAFTTLNSMDATNRGIRSANANVSAINLVQPCSACNPDWRPVTGSTLLTDGVNFTGYPSTFFNTSVTYRGACNSGNGADATWPKAPWTKYDYPPYCVLCD